ncbi:metal dependent phosphohydrolase, partial [mine drainage metagenome]
MTDIIEKRIKNDRMMLLSSAFDVDKCDYLLRDSYYTGVSYGEIEIDRLIQTMSIEDGKMVFGKDETELERFLLGRYHMYRAVYYHKTVVGFEEMVKRAFELLVRDGAIRDPNELMKENNVAEIYGYNDSMFYQKVLDYAEHGKDKELRELCSNIVRRKPVTV